ncbi:MAG: hypothetical protein WC576_00640 [Candidatus Omnitrophota bacterium]|jgi:hypothetical protein
MLSLKKLYILSLILLLFLFISPCSVLAEDTLTITTYYPSPYGVYREMRAKRIAIGDNYIDNADYTWEESDGDGGEIDYLADLVVEGNVGIGTTNPSDVLEIDGTNPILKIGSRIRIKADESNNDAWFGAGSDLNKIKFGDADFSSAMMTISTATGNVGIGTTAPGAKLDIYNPDTVSNIAPFAITNADTDTWSMGLYGTSAYGLYIDAPPDTNCHGYYGTGACRLNDYAEMMEFSEMPKDGDIIVIDKDRPGFIKVSDQSNSQDIVGVASENPAMVIGSYGISIKGWKNNQPKDGTYIYPLALSGRKIINVTDENGDIKPGDKIISSSLKGYGAKAFESGQVVGMAIGGFSSSPEDETVTLPNGRKVKVGKLLIIINVGYARIAP